MLEIEKEPSDMIELNEIDKTDFCPKNQHMRWLKSTIQKEKKNHRQQQEKRKKMAVNPSQSS